MSIRHEVGDADRLARVETLLAKDAIRDVLNRYCFAANRHDLDEIVICFHPDAKIRVLDSDFFPDDLACTRHAFEQGFLAIEDFFELSQYSMGSYRIEVEGDCASAESLVFAPKILKARHGNPRQARLASVRYLDRLNKRDGEWRIASRDIVNEWGLFHPLPEQDVGFFRVPREGLPTVSRRGRDDPSYAFWASHPK